MTFKIEAAAPQDLRTVEALLAAAALTTDGLPDQFPDAYVVARVGNVVVGAAGLELYGSSALLRSVVVAHDRRGQGIARALVENRLTAAHDAGVQKAFLLTTTAESYFRRLGFEPTRRDTAPPELAASVEFAAACPASAICLARTP